MIGHVNLQDSVQDFATSFDAMVENARSQGQLISFADIADADHNSYVDQNDQFTYTNLYSNGLLDAIFVDVSDHNGDESIQMLTDTPRYFFAEEGLTQTLAQDILDKSVAGGEYEGIFTEVAIARLEQHIANTPAPSNSAPIDLGAGLTASLMLTIVGSRLRRALIR